MFTALWKIIVAFNGLPHLAGVSPFLWIPLAILLVQTGLLVVFGKVPPTYVLGNLAVRWRITFMTALAFSLVIVLLTVMLAFVNGMYALTKASGHIENVMILSEGSTDEGFSNFAYGDLGDIENQPGISKLDDGSPLVSREIYLVVAQMIDDHQPGRPKKRFLQVRGIEDPLKAAAIHQLPLFDGGDWFSSAGVRENPENPSGSGLIEVVIGEGIASELWRDRFPEPSGWQKFLGAFRSKTGKDRLEKGDTFELNERKLYVSGVMRSSGSTFDSEIWAKSSIVGPMFGKEVFSTLVAKTPDAISAIELRDFFNKDYKKSSIATQVETDYFAGLSETNVQFLVAIAFVTAFMGIGGLFGVMNTMYAAISQRIKDIGVLRLLGYRRRHILATFLLESVAIALVGGIVGCLLGSLCHGWTANSIVSGGPGGGKFVVLKLTVDAQVICAGLLTALVMGFSGGLLPSLRAMRLTALETLR